MKNPGLAGAEGGVQSHLQILALIRALLFLVLLFLPSAYSLQRARSASQEQPVTRNRPVSETEKQTSRAFKLAIRDVDNQGFRLRENIQTSLDSVNRHLIALFEEYSEPGEHGNMQLRVFEFRDGHAEQLVKQEDEVISFHKLNNRDINGDGLKEVVVVSQCRGTGWDCWGQIHLYQVKNHNAINLTKDMNRELIPRHLVDLNRDGCYEILVKVSKWEEGFFGGHALAPYVMKIFEWKNGSYEAASSEFPSYYDRMIRKLKREIRNVWAEKNESLYASSSIKLLLNYGEKGEAQKGWKEFQRLLEAAPFRSDAWEDRKKAMLEEFKKEVPR